MICLRNRVWNNKTRLSLSLRLINLSRKAFFWSGKSKEQSHEPASDDSSIKAKSKDEKFNDLLRYTGENFPYKLGNTNTMRSNYGWLKRRRLEKEINYANTEYPIFLYIYREFIQAFKKREFKTIKEIMEPAIYEKFKSSVVGIEQKGGEFFVLDDNIKMSKFRLPQPCLEYLLINLTLYEGLYIDRSKNLFIEDYDVSTRLSIFQISKNTFTAKASKNKSTSKADFSKILVDREQVVKEEILQETLPAQPKPTAMNYKGQTEQSQDEGNERVYGQQLKGMWQRRKSRIY